MIKLFKKKTAEKAEKKVEKKEEKKIEKIEEVEEKELTGSAKIAQKLNSLMR